MTKDKKDEKQKEILILIIPLKTFPSANLVKDLEVFLRLSRAISIIANCQKVHQSGPLSHSTSMPCSLWLRISRQSQGMSHTVVTEQFLCTLTVTAGSDAGSWSEQIKVSLLSQAIPNAGSVAHCHSNQSRLAVTALIHVGPVTQHVNGRSLSPRVSTQSH